MNAITLDMVQGSREWLEFYATSRSASKLPAAKGNHKYMSRNELLTQLKLGVTRDVDSNTQALFDKGHAAELAGRVIAEKIIGEALSPVVMSRQIEGMTLAASLDGINFDGDIEFECKLWNAKLAADIRTGILDPHYTDQLDQQLLVAGAKKTLFMATDGTEENTIWMWYETTQAKIDAVVSAWKQVEKDLAAYVPPEIIPEVVAAPIKDLPAITYKMDGMRLSTNLRDDVKPAILALVEQSKKKLENDQDFADLDALCKKFKQAEEQCALVQSQAVGEIKDVDAFCRDLKELAEVMRQARLAGEKAVTSEKENRKLSIIIKARADYLEHVEALESEIMPILILKGPADIPDFAGAMKGMKKLSAMQEAVDNTLRNGKMAADVAAKNVRSKLAWCKENAAGMSFLFPDLQGIISMELEAFTATITNRIRTHKEAESEREATATARIEADAKARAEREVVEKMAEAAQVKQPASEQSTPPVLDQVADRQSNQPNTDSISAFLKLRDFGKEENKVRAILVEFVKFTGGYTA